MQVNKWLDRTQPQTLMVATILMYVNAALGILYGTVLVVPIGTLLVLGPVAAGWGIANEKKWGYWLGVVFALLQIGYLVRYGVSVGSALNVLFYGALVALLLHPQSRQYRRTWFR